MTEPLTKKQKGFVKDYLDTGNMGLAAKMNYDVKNDNTARSIGSENLTKPNIRQAIEDHAEKAESMIYKLSQEAEAEAVRLNASKDILDRAGYGAIVKSQSVNVNINTTTKNLEIASKYEEEIKNSL